MSARVLTSILSIALVATPVIADDCINYGSYMHWVGGTDLPDNAWGLVIAGRRSERSPSTHRELRR